MFLMMLDVTAVNVALPTLRSDLGWDPERLAWVVDGYVVAIASLLPTAGAIGDRVGHRRCVIGGLVAFGAASALCAGAPGPLELVAGRVAQGAAAAVLLPCSTAVLVERFPDRSSQARVVGVWAGISSLALPLGPVAGGWLVEHGGWRAIFAMNVPFVLAAVAALPFVVGPSPVRRHPVDVLGALLAPVALGAAVLTVVEAGRSGPSPLVLAAGGAALVSTAALVVGERRVADAMLPPALLRYPSFIGANGVAFVMNFVTNGTLFCMAQYLQVVLGRSPLSAGTWTLAMFVPLAGLAPVAGHVAARAGVRAPMFMGAGVAAVTAALLVRADARGPMWLVALVLGGLGAGTGLLTAPAIAAALRSVPGARAGIASGLNNASRQAGTALGVAMFGAIAGDPARTERFVGRLHGLAAFGACAWVLAMVLTEVLVEAPRR